MREADRARRERVADAAYEVLRERGYRRASLLEIAKAARVSNQTMYRWYGSKSALFRALIESNAAQARQPLVALTDGCSDPIATLGEVARQVLRTVTSDRAIDLNRAAAVDASESAELGAALATAGRGQIVPLLTELIGRAHSANLLNAPDASAAAETWVALVIGDLQIRLVTGGAARPSDDELDARAEQALRAFAALHGASVAAQEGN